MIAPIQSEIDSSILNALRARRLNDPHALSRIGLLRRLRRQYEQCTLPKTFRETNVEQSFNEQLFSAVFNYRTLFSHDRLPYHLHPKRYITETGRYDDFSLGFFGAVERVAIASAELKDPGFDLDKQQGNNYGGLTPVQQAFKATRGTECQWIIVSNYSELRLYQRIDLPTDNCRPPNPFVIALLHEIKDRDDLARLRSHFDQAALIGNDTTHEGELMSVVNSNHPALPIPPQIGSFRTVLLFTPQSEFDLPLFLVESRLRVALDSVRGSSHFFPPKVATAAPEYALDLNNGWITATNSNIGNIRCKIAMSALGQIQVSIERPFDTDPTLGSVIHLDWILEASKFFADLIVAICDRPGEPQRKGRASIELRDIAGVKLLVPPHQRTNMVPHEGLPVAPSVLSADFEYTPKLDPAEQLAVDLVSEIAIYFRSPVGGVGFDRENTKQKIRKT